MTNTAKDRWEKRYGTSDDYVYGTAPNDFLKEVVAELTPGRALCLADGEGRNGVYLAQLGHTVTSVDLTAAGSAKTLRLADNHNVELVAVTADLADYDLGAGDWDLIVSIFAHTVPDTRRHIHARIANALAPGGLFVLEAYTPDQVGRGTGGPQQPELTMTLDGLREELTNMHLVSGRETVRSVIEGPGHTGDGAVVQVTATPA